MRIFRGRSPRSPANGTNESGHTAADPSATSTASGISARARKPKIKTLEPRMVFDAAADATYHQAEAGGSAQLPADSADAHSPLAPLWDALQQGFAESQAVGNGASAATAAAQEIIFVDQQVEDISGLLASISRPGTEIILLDTARDGIEQIAEALADRSSLSAIRIISHGSEGTLQLGTGVLNAESMQGQYLAALQNIGAALSSDGDILIYGCNFTAGDAGLKAAMVLGGITGADIAASDDLTGSTKLGGDWDLETETGSIEANVIKVEGWEHLLVAPTLDLNTGTAGNNHTTTYTEGGAGVAVVGTTVITDPDSTNMASAQVVLTDAKAGDQFTFSAAPPVGITRTVDTSVPGQITVNLTGTDSIANYQTALSQLRFSSTSDDPTVGGTATTRTITFNVNDGTASSNLPTTTVAVSAVNDAPVNTLPASYTTSEDVSLQLTGLSIADVDAASGTMSVTLGVDSGTLTATSAGGVTVTGSGTASLVLSGTLANINIFLAGAGAPTFIPVANANGAVTLTMTTGDGGNTGTGGTLTDIDTRTITVNAVNDAPVNTLPASYTTSEEVSLQLTGLSIADGDAASGTMSVTLGVNSGTLTAASAGGVVVTGSGTASLVLSGTLANINIFLAGAGAPTFVPAANANGAVTLTMTTGDGGNTGTGGTLTDIDTRTITVTAVNDAPAGTNATLATNEDSPYTFSAADFGFTDPNDSPANALQSVIITTLPALGSLTLSGSAVTAGQTIAAANIPNLVWTPPANVNGASYTSFTFQVIDDGGTANGGINIDASANTITFNVNAVNDAPAGADITLSTNEDTAYTFSAANFGFSDAVEGNALLGVRITTLATAGTIRLSGVAVTAGQFIPVANIGSLTWTPPANGNGTALASFTFQVRDNGGTANGGIDTDPTANTVSFNVAAVNDAPVVNLDPNNSGGGANNSSFNNYYNPTTDAPVTIADTDATITDVDNASLLSASLAVSGGAYVTSNNERLRIGGTLFLLGTNYSGVLVTVGSTTFSINYSTTGTDTFTITKNGGGLAPVADWQALLRTIQYDNVAASPAFGDRDFSFSVNDGALTSTARVGTITVVNPATAPTIDLDASGAGTGWSATYTENGAAVAIADTDSLITDASNAKMAFATVTLTNKQTGDYFTVNGTTVANGSTGTVSSVSYSVTDTGGVITISFSGLWAKANYEAAIESVRFANSTENPNTTQRIINVTVNNGLNVSPVAVSTINVVAVNDAPVNTLPVSYTTNEDVSLQLTGLSIADVDAGVATMSVTLGVNSGSLTAASAGGVTVTGSGTASLVLSGTLANINTFLAGAGAPTFVPVANENGSVTLTMTTGDGGNTGTGGTLTDIDTRTITVNALNDAPAGTNATLATNEDSPYTFSAADFGFTDPNDSPANTLQSVIITTLPASGTLRLSGVAVAAGQTITAASIPNLVWTPPANVSGTGYTSFTFRVVDDGGTANGGVNTDASANTITFNITAANDAPAGFDKSVSVIAGTTFTFAAGDFLTTDPLDPSVNSLASVIITSLPANGSLTLSGAAVTAGQTITLAQIPNLVWTAPATASGSSYTSFSFQLVDNGGTANGGQNTDQSANIFTFDVIRANADSIATNEDASGTLNVLSNDGLVGPAGLRTITSVTQGANGSVSIGAGGDVTYTPAANFSGTDSFTYTVEMLSPGFATQFFNSSFSNTVTSIPTSGGNASVQTGFNVNALSLAHGDNGEIYSVYYAAKIYIATAGTYTFFTSSDDGSDLSIDGAVVVNNDGLHGLVEVSGAVALTAGYHDIVIRFFEYTGADTLTANYSGPDTSSVKTSLADNANVGLLKTVTGTVDVTVTSVNDAPAGADKTITADEDTAVTLAAADFGFTDIEGNTLQAVKITTLPANGVLRNNGVAVTAGDFIAAADIAAGRLVWTPASNANGVGYANFTFQVQDNGGTANGGVELDPSANTITFDLTPVNDAPAGVNDSAVAIEDIASSGNVLSNDTDVDGNPLSVTQFVWNGSAYAAGATATVAGVGTLVINSNGTFTFTPVANYNGAVPLATYTLSDGSLSALATLTIGPIVAVPDGAPVIDLDTQAAGTTRGGWSHNSPAGTLAMDSNIDANYIASAANELLGAGLSHIPNGSTMLYSGADTLTFGEAVAQNDFIEYSFTTAAALPANSALTHLSYGINGINATNYQISVAISADGFATSNLIASNVAVPQSASYAYRQFNVTDTALVASTTYTIRVYTYGASAPGPIEFDDFNILIGTDPTSYETTYTENGAPVLLSAASSAVEDSDTTFQQSAIIVLTNAQAGDRLTLGAMNAAITGVVDTSVPGQVTVTLTGSASRSNYATAIRNIVFDNTTENPATIDRQVHISVNDGFQSSNVAVTTIHVTAVNDAPVNTLPASYTTSEDVSLQLTGLSIADVDAASGTMSVTLGVDSGTLTAASAGGVTVTGSGTASLVLSGTLADINTFLASAGAPTFIPVANANGAVTLTMTTGDGGNTGTGGTLTDIDTRTITVNAVNDAPVNTLPASYATNEDVSLQLTGLSIADVDAASGTMSVTLGVDSGTLTATSAGGVTVTGSGTASLVLSGTLANINTFLAGAGAPTFVPVANANGAVTLTMTTGDGGNTGTGGMLTDIDTRTITVNAVNDAPVNTLPVSYTTSEDVSLQLTGLSIADGDAASGTMSVTLGVNSGTLTAASAGGVTVTGSGTASLVLSGTLANINTFLSGAGAPTFIPAANANGAVTLTMTTGDGGNTGTGGTLTDIDTRTITVNAVNDAPVDGNDTNSVNEDVTLAVAAASGVLFGSSDVDGDTLTVTGFSVAGDSNVYKPGTTASIAGVGIISIAANGSYSFTPAADYNGSVPLVSYTISDGQSGADSSTLQLSIIAINDRPVVDLSQPATTVEYISNGSFESGLTGWTVGGGTVHNPNVYANGPVVPSHTGSRSLDLGPSGTGGENGGWAEQTINLTVPGTYTLSFWYSTEFGAASGPVGGVGYAPMGVALSGVVNQTLTVEAASAGYQRFEQTFQVAAAGALTIRFTDQFNGLVTSYDPILDTVSLTGPSSANTSFATTFTENGAAVAIADIDAVVSDVDHANIASAKIVLTNKQIGDVLSVGTLPAGIAYSLDTSVAGEITVNLTNVASKADYAAALQAITFANTSESPSTADRVINVTVSDGLLDSNAAVATIHVVSVNDAPAGADKTITTNEDVAVPLYASDFGFTDIDGNSLLAVKITTLPGNGVLRNNSAVVTAGDFITAADIAAGRLVFTPAADGNGTGYASLTFQVQDNGGTANSGVDLDPSANTLTFNVTPVNDAPAGANKTITTNEDTAVTLSATDFGFTDIDGNALHAVKITTLPANGALTNNGTAVTAGQFITAVDIAAGRLVWTPAANANGTGYANFTFQVQDNGGTANSGADLDPSANTITFNVTPVNDAPAGVNNSIATNEDVAATGNVLTNDTDVDGPSLSVTQFVWDGTTYAAGATATIAGKGTLLINADGTYTFTPALNYNGAVPTATYTLSDGALTATATLAVSITAVNDAPVGVADAVTIDEDTTASGNVLTNDTDVDGPPLSVTQFIWNGTTYTAGSTASVAGVGSLFIGSNGAFTFVPDANYNGAPPVATYTLTDGSISRTSTLTIAVTPVNDAPVIDLDQDDSTEKDADYLGAFTEGDAPVHIVDKDIVVVDVDAGEVNSVIITLKSFSDGSAEVIVIGGEVFVYETPGSAKVDVNGQTLLVDFDGHQFSIVEIGGKPLATGTVEALLVSASYENQSVNPTEGDRHFLIVVNDGEFDSNVALSTIRVTSVNSAPVGNPDSASTREDNAVSGNVLSNDSDIEGNALSVTQFVWNGTVYSAGATASVAGVGSLTIASDGAYTFTPAANYNGAVPTADYTLTDGSLTATSTLALSITSVNDAPAGGNNIYTLMEDATLVLTTGHFQFTDASDSPANAFQSVIITTVPAVGTLTLNGAAVTAGQVVTVADINAGKLAYVSATGVSGVSIANFSFQVVDNGGVANGGQNTDQTPNTIAFSVVSVNDAPAGTNATLTTNEDTAYTFAAANFGFTDPNDTPANALQTVIITTLPANGTLRLSGVSVTAGQSVAAAQIPNLTWTPPANANGIGYASFTFQVVDDGGTANGGTDTDASPNTITFNVTAVNDAPVGVNNSLTTDEDIAGTGNVLTNDSDVDGDVLSVTQFVWNGTAYTAGTTANIAGKGSLVINTDGTFTFTPAANYNGAVPVATYTLSDGALIATATLAISITPVNDAPVGINDSVTTNEDVAATGNVLTNDSDVDGNAVVVTQFVWNGTTYAAGTTATISGRGSLVINSDGTFTFTPAANYNGAVPIATYTVSDGALMATTTLDFSIIAVNDTPALAAPASFSTLEDTDLALTGLVITDVDAAGSSIRLTVSVPAGEGTIQWTTTAFISASGAGTSTLILQGQRSALNSAIAAGSITYRPATHFTGATNLTVTINDRGNTGIDPGLTGDASSEEATRTIPITVTSVNDAPAGTNTTLTTNEDTAYTFATTNFGFTDPNDAPANMLQSVIITTLPANGTLNLSGSAVTAGQTIAAADIANLVWTPPANANGAGYTSFTFQVVDNGGIANSGVNTDASPNTITFNVTPVNDAPAAPPLAPLTSQDAEVISQNIGALFSDVDGDALTFSIAGLPAGLTYNSSTGQVTGTLLSNASQGGVNGAYNISVTANDGNGGVTVRTFTWMVTNPAPVAQDDLVSGLQNNTLSGSVFVDNGSGADSDPDGDSFVVSAVNGSAANLSQIVNGTNGGKFTIAANGAYTFNPGTDFVDVAVGATRDTQITYQISDGQGGIDTAVVTVRITGVNDAPVSSAIGNQINLDSDAVAFNVAPSFSDPDHDALTFGATGLPPGLSINAATGEITGTLDASASQGGASGVYSVTVTATDSHGAVSSQSFSWSISNPLPTANNDSVTLDEDTTANINVLGNDVDPDADPLVVTAATAAHGIVTINPDGTLTYTPDANYNGPDTIIYSISDGNGGTSTATVNVTVTPANDAPTSSTVPDIHSTDGGGINFNVSAYFDDIDARDPNVPSSSRDSLTYSATGLPPGLSIDPVTGIISGTLPPNASDTTPYHVIITATDGDLQTATASFDWHVENLAPVAGPDYVTIAEDSGAVTVLVTGNDNDPDGDAFTLIDTAGTFSATHGTVSINAATGEVTYTPNANFNGIDTVTYTIRDSDGALGVGMLTVTVTPANDAPTKTQIPSANSLDGQAVSINTGTYFDDIDRADAVADSLTFSAVSLPPGLSINAATGVISGTIDHTASGVTGTQIYSVTVTATDSAGATVTNIFNWTVTNPAPTANNNSAATTEDSAVTINVLGNDSDPDGDTLVVDQAAASHGTLLINGDGTLTYTPDANFNGSDTILYRISDGNGGFATATVAVTVSAVNDAPTSSAIPVQTSDDSAVITFAAQSYFSDVDLNDATPDHLAFSATGLPDGLSIDPVTGVISGTIAHDASQNYPGGVHAVTITVEDDAGLTSSQTFSWIVNNPAPVALGDLASGNEDDVITGDAASNDNDPDGDTLVYSVTPVVAPLHGTVVIQPDGSYTYTPNANFNGTDTFTYAVSDQNGGVATATVTITIAPVNDAPVAAIDSVSTNEDTAVTIAVLGNDTDVDLDPLSVTAASAASGIVTINPDGTLNYIPAANFNGIDTITYTISDGQGGISTATVTVNVVAVNDPPVAADDSTTTAEDTAVTISVLTNDSDIDGDALVVATATAANGTVTINADGTITYVPNANFNGTDTISYTISDGNGGTASAQVTVTVTPVNDPPVAVADTATTLEDTPVTIAVLANDADVDGNGLSVTSAVASSGTVTINPDGTLHYIPAVDFHGTDTITYTISDGNGGTSTASVTVTVTAANDIPVAVGDTVWTQEDTAVSVPVLQNDTDSDGDALTVTAASALNGSVVIEADGTISYTPNANFHGADTITYTISDGQGGIATATVAVTVAPVNDAPVAAADTVTTQEDAPVTISVLSNDSDNDGDPLSVIYAVASGGAVTINPDGTLHYVPAANFNGTDVITYTISDGAGGTSTATVSVTVTPANDAPVAANDTATAIEDTPSIISVLGNDTDADGDTLQVTSATATNGTVTVNPDGTLSYTPNGNFNGVDTITYTVSDGNGGVSTATVMVTVVAHNDVPVAVNDTVVTPEDVPAIIPVLGNDTDIDGDALTVVSAIANHGVVTLNSDGTITYVPDANFNGTDFITYTISDGAGGTSTATVKVTVTPVNDAPVAAADIATTAEDSPVDIAVLANDTDADGNALEVMAAQAVHGTVTINRDGTITYNPDANFHGSDTITYTVSDGRGGFSTATVAVSVTSVNDAPQALADAMAVVEDSPVSGNVLTNDTDMEGNALVVAGFTIGGVQYPAGTSVTLAAGVFSLGADGAFTFVPAPNYNGPVPGIVYFISDGEGGTSAATLSLGPVAPVNDAPTGTGLTLAATDTDPISGAISASDIDGDTLTFSLQSAPRLGAVTLNPDGRFTYTPTRGSEGTDSFIVLVSDGHGGTTTVTVTVAVARNDVDHVPAGPSQPSIPEQPAATNPAPLAPITANGIVLETVNSFGGLRSATTSLNADRPVVTAVNDAQNLNGTGYLDQPAGPRVIAQTVQRLEQGSAMAMQAALGRDSGPFEARTFLGDSSAIVLKGIDRAGQTEEVRIETIRHRGIIYLQLVEQSAASSQRDVIDYRIRMADGTPVPQWLRRVGPETYAGHPDANSGVLDLIITAVRRDGLVTEHAVRMDAATGQLSDVPGRADSTSLDLPASIRAPLFSEQMVEQLPPPPPAIDDLERALGLR